MRPKSVINCVDIINMSGRSPLTPSEGFRRAADAAPGAFAASPATVFYQPGRGTPPVPGRAARWLDRALRIVDGGPRPCYRAAIVSLGVTSALAVGVAILGGPPGSLSTAAKIMIAIALACLSVSVALWLASRSGPPAGRPRPAARLDRLVAPRERAALWLALTAWFPLLLVVVYYRARAAFPPPVQYLYFPFEDKRWVTAAYLLGVIAPAILLITAARVLLIAESRPPTWRAWFTGLFLGSPR